MPPTFHEEVHARTRGSESSTQNSTNPASGESSFMPKASGSASPDVVGRFDFLHIEDRVVPSQTQPFVFLGTIKESFLFEAAVY